MSNSETINLACYRLTEKEMAEIEMEIYKEDSADYHSLIDLIVETRPRLAWAIVDRWLEKHGKLIIDQRLVNRL